ncbi:MAG: hypothetical protein H0U74_13595 [Bradymonadaceae bacterium]|nr:hypothetical protein [Lujinxingiaceae bacterium]
MDTLNKQARDVARIILSTESIGHDWSEAQALAFFSNCFDRDSLLKVLMGYVSKWLSHRVVAVAGKGGLQPYFVEEWPDLPAHLSDFTGLRSVHAPIGASALALNESGLMLTSPVSAGLSPLFEKLAVAVPFRVAVLPVRLAGRTAMLLIGVPTSRAGSSGLDEPSESFDIGALEAAADAVGRQLEELIMRAKSNTLPPTNERIPALPEPAVAPVYNALDEKHLPPAGLGDSLSNPRHTQQLNADDLNLQARLAIAERADAQMPSATNFGMPVVSIEELSDAMLTDEEQPNSIIDEGWDDMLGAAASPTNEASASPKEMLSEAAIINPARTLMGGFSIVDGVPEVNFAGAHTEKAAPDAAPTSAEPEFVRPELDEELSEASSASLPRAQIFKRSKTLSQASLKAVGPAPAPAPVAEPEPAPEPVVKPEPMAEAEPAMKPQFAPPGSPQPIRETALDRALELGPQAVQETALDRALRHAGQSEASEVELGRPGPERPNSSATIVGLAERSNAHSRAKRDAWLEEFRADEAEPAPRQNSDTVRLVGSNTESFGAMLGSLEFDALRDNPMTIPPEALEELLDSGPLAIDVQSSLALLDSRDRKLASSAAEHVATAGSRSLEALEALFPGRLFVDRYQYTPQSLPPVREHGAVLEALVRIGTASIEVVRKFIDHNSLELRFYATLLLTELPAEGMLDRLVERLFDRDQQTRALAQQILSRQRLHRDFEHLVLQPLRNEVQENREELRVEVAADSLRVFKDTAAISRLIDALDEHGGRVQQTIHQALRAITLQDLSASIAQWRNWWFDASGQKRSDWLIEALNAPSDQIRQMAFEEVELLPGLELNYHPDQPVKLRARAQQDLAEWYARR